MKNVSENVNHFQKKCDKSNQQLTQLKVLDIQEKERSRIARELHDSSLQDLTHLIHMIELSSMYIDKDPISAKLELESCSQSLKKIIGEIRDTIFNLRPMTFDDLGFKQCIQNDILELQLQHKNCEITCECDDFVIVKDDEKAEIYNLFLVTLYRVIQEALINSLKHAEAGKVHLSIKENEQEIVVEIIDDGKGFDINRVAEDSDNKHFGMSIMYERIYLLNGTIEIDSDINVGTKIGIIVPKP